MITLDTLPTLREMEERSPAVRNLLRDLQYRLAGPIKVYEPIYSPTVNLGLTNVCQSGHHDLCAGLVVVTHPDAPWRCRCLCHHARDRER